MAEPGQVFISYARDGQRGQAIAYELYQQLTRAGIPAFYDVEEILTGSYWAEVIERAIINSRVMVVILSQAALDPDRWVQRECLFAQARQIPIVPVMVESLLPPLWLAHINALDFKEQANWPRLFRAVMEPLFAAPLRQQEQAIQLAEPTVQKTVLETTTAAIHINKAKPISPKVQGLLDSLASPELTPPERLKIGNQLDEWGDPRPGVGLDEKGLPDIDWVDIPAGVFSYQEGRQRLPAFRISRYPVTNSQFWAFTDAGAYEQEEWWQGLQKPDKLPEHRWYEGNRPVENVNWYEALAFCRWLSKQRAHEITLPTEQQWEKAARGRDGRVYPWGNDYVSGYANIDETEKVDGKKQGDYYLRQTCAVGLYPQGVSPYGVQDMAGNVWEWCLNKYEKSDQVEVDASNDYRVVRGGSWNSNTVFCRASFRFCRLPLNRYFIRGFRVICAPH